MDGLYIIHYYYPGTDPWKNIMALRSLSGIGDHEHFWNKKNFEISYDVTLE